MIIAAHFFNFKKEGSYLAQCCEILATNNPTDQFIFFVAEQKKAFNSFPSNCKIIAVSPPLRNGLLLHYWNNFKLPSILKKYNAGVFITETNSCSLRTLVPQCMITGFSRPWQKSGNRGPYVLYIKRFFAKFVATAAAIVVAEKYLEKSLLLTSPAAADKVVVGHIGLPVEYKPMNADNILAQQQKITDGYAYFLFDCNAATKRHTTAVLKAYSLFKKRLKSNLRLVISLQQTSIELCVPDFKNYKYKNEVSIISHAATHEYAAILGAAYAFIYLADDNDFGKQPGLQAMQCRVPVIASDAPDTVSVYHEAALYSQGNEKLLAEQMMILYKDEAQRSALIEKGLELVSAYSRESAAATLWQTILQISRD